MRTDVDVVVVGGGVMGSAAAWQAAKGGSSVVLLEQFEKGHAVGASHGMTRNFNVAYEQDDYLQLVTEARTLWDELATESGRTLLDLVGLVNHGHVEPLRRMAQQHGKWGIESSFLSPGEATARWPGMRFRSEVLYVAAAGRVRAADALDAFHQVATSAGADFRYATPVRSLGVDRDSAVVVTDREEIRARRGIVTVGAWSEKLLSPHLTLPRLVVTQEQPAHFAPRDDSYDWPSFNHTPDPAEPDDAYWYSETYGMHTPGEGVKVGWHGVGPVTDPDARTYQPEPVQLEALQRYAAEWLPGVDATSPVPISCTYTSTDTGDFVLGRHGPFAIGAGFSGKGFKFAPAVGRVLVDLTQDMNAAERFTAPLAAADV